MTLFVGGSRHGADVDVRPQPQTALDIATDQPKVLPSTYVDAATGEQWRLAPVQFNHNNPLTGVPDEQWEHQVYVLAELTDPGHIMAGLQDAVTRWWFLTHGTHKLLSTQDNGRSRTRYFADCEQCKAADVLMPRLFETVLERARWLRAHIDETGHRPGWSDWAPTTEGGTNGSQDQGHVHEGHEGV